MPGTDSSVKCGKQRTVIQLMQPVSGADVASGAAVQYVPFGSYLFAEKSPASARASYKAGQATSQVTIPIAIRYMPGVAANMIVNEVESTQGVYRVVSQYSIEGIVDVDGRHRKLMLACLALGGNY